MDTTLILIKKCVAVIEFRCKSRWFKWTVTGWTRWSNLRAARSSLRTTAPI